MSTDPAIIIGGDHGFHNRNQRRTAKRLKESGAYRDLSTIWVTPTRGMIPDRVAESWLGLMLPMNQRVVRLFMRRMEVGEAYNRAVETILGETLNGQPNPLREFKYMLTVEEDNVPPPDGLLKLYESIDEYAVVAGLYYTKGEGGMPMIYGDPKGLLSFNPQIPKPGAIQECNGTGMGFTLFDLNLFRDERIPRPWFKTVQEWSLEGGGGQGTQDLYFAANVRRAGYRIASDNRVRVGHLDSEDQLW